MALLGLEDGFRLLPDRPSPKRFLLSAWSPVTEMTTKIKVAFEDV